MRQIRGKVEIACDDLGPQTLKNIAEPIWAWMVKLGTASVPRVSPALSLPEKPSIAVLPFQNMSGDPDQEYFADGLAEDIITELSLCVCAFVLQCTTFQSYDGSPPLEAGGDLIGQPSPISKLWMWNSGS
jgi:adenylate cyclase